jgi:energy-converting hydrogenase Eha subunit C
MPRSEALHRNPLPPNSDAAIRDVAAIMARVGLTYCEVANAAHVAPATARAMLLTGQLPRQESTRRRILTFVRVNASAQSRGDVRLIPRPFVD